MKLNIVIVDYGLGNIFSAQQSFIKSINDNNINAQTIITNKPKGEFTIVLGGNNNKQHNKISEAEALNGAMKAFKNSQPIGDGIGPMVVGNLMLEHEKKTIAKKHLLPKTIKSHGLKKNEIKYNDSSLTMLMRSFSTQLSEVHAHV